MGASKLTAAVVILLVTAAHARFFMGMIPNGVNVPCINNEPGCHGLPLCESYGHFDCFPARPLNGFGMLYKPDPTGLWDVLKCSADSDGDGFTNGDEFGDPCCSWNYGDASPKYTTDISSPNHASSVPPRPSCSSAAALFAPELVTIGLGASGSTLVVSWATSDFQAGHPVFQHSCICSYRVRMVVTQSTVDATGAATGGNNTVEYSMLTPGTFVTTCGLQPGATVQVFIAAANRAGMSAEVGPAFITVPSLAGTSSYSLGNVTVNSASPIAGPVGTRTQALLTDASSRLCVASQSVDYASLPVDHTTESPVFPTLLEGTSIVAKRLEGLIALPANDWSFRFVSLLAPATVRTKLPEQSIFMPHTGSGFIIATGINTTLGSGQWMNVTFDAGGIDDAGRIRLVLIQPTEGVKEAVVVWFSSIVLGAIILWAAHDPISYLRSAIMHAPLACCLHRYVSKGASAAEFEKHKKAADRASTPSTSTRDATGVTGGGQSKPSGAADGTSKDDKSPPAAADATAVKATPAAPAKAEAKTSSPATSAKSSTRRKGSRCRMPAFVSWFTPEMATVSWGFLIVYATCVGGVAAIMRTTYPWFQHERYSFGHDLPLERTIGYGATIAMGIMLLPVTRNSIWLYLLGVPFERALRLHRWMGLMVFVCTVWHGIGFCVNFASNPFGLKYLLKWSPSDAINPLAGTIAGISIVVIVLCSISPIRRRWYELTLAAHMLWPIAVAMTFLHTWGSRATAVPMLIPGILLLGLDYLIMAADWLLRPVVLVQAGVISDKPLDVDWHRTAYFVCEKKARWSWLQSLWPFTYEPGQYMWIAIPQVSVAPHPYSISSIPDPLHPGRFTVHMKSMGFGSWSDSVITNVLGRTPEGWRIPGPPGSHAILAEAFAAGSSPESTTPDEGDMPGYGTGHKSSDDKMGQHAPYVNHSLKPIKENGPVPSAKSEESTTRPAVATGGASPSRPHVPRLSPHTGTSPIMPSSPVSSKPLTDIVPYAVPYEGLEVIWPGTKKPRRRSMIAANPNADPEEEVKIPRMHLSIWAIGPFGRPAVQLENYRHFVLIAGGIGITPIAPLHYALLHGLPVGPVSTGLAKMFSCYGACAKGGKGGHVKAVADSVTTVWTTRDRSLLEAFAPMLGSHQPVEDEAEVPAKQVKGKGKRAPRTSLTSPAANPVHLGNKLAKHNKFKTSFCIQSKMTIQRSASSKSAKDACNVELRLFLTSGRKPQPKPAALPAHVLPATAAPTPDAAPTQVEVATPPPAPSPGGRRPPPPPPRPGSGAGSLWRAITPRGNSARANAGADEIDMLTAAKLAQVNAEAREALPNVNKERPNLPRVFTDIGMKLREARTAAANPAANGTDSTGAPVQAGFFARAWAMIAAFFCCFRVRRTVEAKKAAGEQAVPPSRYSVETDPAGRTPVAVVVCGPNEMVVQTIRACHDWNAGPGGEHVVFHVHHETFNF